VFFKRTSNCSRWNRLPGAGARDWSILLSQAGKSCATCARTQLTSLHRRWDDGLSDHVSVPPNGGRGRWLLTTAEGQLSVRDRHLPSLHEIPFHRRNNWRRHSSDLVGPGELDALAPAPKANAYRLATSAKGRYSSDQQRQKHMRRTAGGRSTCHAGKAKPVGSAIRCSVDEIPSLPPARACHAQ
jgi:hypothetical protein